MSEQDPWYCSNCQSFRCATKKMDLFSLPRLLICHLKRFAYTSRSRGRRSPHSWTSPSQDWTSPTSALTTRPPPTHRWREDSPSPSYIYDLWAVSNHMGGLGGGHYTAYVKNRVNGKWYLHDDSRVTPASEEDIKSSSAYVCAVLR